LCDQVVCAARAALQKRINNLSILVAGGSPEPPEAIEVNRPYQALPEV
jgi:hypothetical protein